MKTYQYDRKWSNDKGFVYFDFNNPEIAESLLNSFDVVVIDPPFITSEVWIKYSQVCTQLIKKSGKVILTTILENALLLNELFGATPTVRI